MDFRDNTNLDYYKLFKALVDVINVRRGWFGYHPGLYQKKIMEMKAEMTIKPGDAGYDGALNIVKPKARGAQCKEYKTTFFLQIADGKCYSVLKDQLDDLNLLDKDRYSTAMESALCFIQNYKGVGSKSREQNLSITKGLNMKV
jgi:hypothetical protein